MARWTQKVANGIKRGLKNFFSPDDGASFMSGLQNQFTGNLDYQRDLEKLGLQQQFNALEAQKQRDFEREMSNTSYQRAVADLKAAGLNPALVAGGNGASVPVGSSASSGASSHSASGAGFAVAMNALASVMNRALDRNASLATSAMNVASREREANIRADSAREVAWIYRRHRK